MMVVFPTLISLSKLKFCPTDLIFHIKAADEMNRGLEGQSEGPDTSHSHCETTVIKGGNSLFLAYLPHA